MKSSYDGLLEQFSRVSKNSRIFIYAQAFLALKTTLLNPFSELFVKSSYDGCLKQFLRVLKNSRISIYAQAFLALKTTLLILLSELFGFLKRLCFVYVLL